MHRVILYDHLSLFSEISPTAHSANYEDNRVLRHSYDMNFFKNDLNEVRRRPVIVFASRIEFSLSVILPAILQANKLFK